jgi:hypothetical protein
MKGFLFGVMLILFGMFIGHAYTLEKARQGDYVWCKQ